MNKKDSEIFAKLIKKAVGCKPTPSPKKRRKAPTKKQLEEVFFLDRETMTIKILDEPNA